MGSLRIIGGSARGRRLAGPRRADTRPTADRVRQVVFDVLGQRLPGGEVLDLYAGTGALGLEALSRGAARARLVDRSVEATELCRKNAAALGWDDRVEVLRLALPAGLARLEGRPVDLLFADPPYADEGACGEVLRWAAASGILRVGGTAVLEHGRRTELPEAVGALRAVDGRRFGDTVVSFYASEG